MIILFPNHIKRTNYTTNHANKFSTVKNLDEIQTFKYSTN